LTDFVSYNFLQTTNTFVRLHTNILEQQGEIIVINDKLKDLVSNTWV
jgi:hypothetical protein